MVATPRTPRRSSATTATDGIAATQCLKMLTARGFSSAHKGLTQGLRKAGITLQTMSSWERLLLIPDDEIFDAVLVDLDAVERDSKGKQRTMSGHRLVSLLAKQLAAKPTALVVMTRLDYAEVEELARGGVHVFLTPDLSPSSCAEHIRARIGRIHTTRSRHAPLRLDDSETRIQPLDMPSTDSAHLLVN